MEELTKEQEFTMAKYAMDGCIQKLEGDIKRASFILESATTVEDLEQAKVWLDMAVSAYTSNIAKFTIPKESKTK